MMAATDDAAIIDARYSMRQRKIRRYQAHLRLRKKEQITHDGPSRSRHGIKSAASLQAI
jgi:hypothetical protein